MAPAFDVQVNQAGSITVDFDGNPAHDQTITVSAAGTITSSTAQTLLQWRLRRHRDLQRRASPGRGRDSTGYTIDTVGPTLPP